MVSGGGAYAMKSAQVLALVTCLALAACAAERPMHPIEQLDERTAVTRRWMAAPIVLAPEAGVAATTNPDWLHLGLVEVNRQGTYTQYLGLVAWRGGEAAGTQLALPLPARLRLLAGTGEVTLAVATDGARLAGDGARSPLAAPFGVLEVSWYAIDTTTVALLARDGIRGVELPAAAGGPLTFVPWDAADGPGQRALAAFAASLTAPP